MNKELNNKIKKLAKEIKNISDMESLEKFCNKYEIKTLHSRSESFYEDFKKEIVYGQPFKHGKSANIDCIHNKVKINIGITFTNYKEYNCHKNYPKYDDVKIKIDYIDIEYGINYFDWKYGIVSIDNNEIHNIIDEIAETYNECEFDTEYNTEFVYWIDKKYNKVDIQ